jgi:hypothetical protein
MVDEAEGSSVLRATVGDTGNAFSNPSRQKV